MLHETPRGRARSGQPLARGEMAGEHTRGVRRVFPCHVPAYTARALLAREAVPTRVPGSL